MDNNKLQKQLIKVKLDKQVAYYVKLADFSDENILLDTIAANLLTQACILFVDGFGIKDNYFVEITNKIRQLCSQFFATLIIKQRADIVLLSEADGILLDKNSITAHEALSLLGENTIIGITENSEDEHISFNVIKQKIKSGFINKELDVLELKQNG